MRIVAAVTVEAAILAGVVTGWAEQGQLLQARTQTRGREMGWGLRECGLSFLFVAIQQCLHLSYEMCLTLLACKT
jgi:hypothetical protein